jgi:hypothetical protein
MAERVRPTPDRYSSRVPPEPPPQVDQTWRGGEERREFLHGMAMRTPPPIATKAEAEAGHTLAGVGEPITGADLAAAAPSAHPQKYGMDGAKVSDRYPKPTTEECYRGWMKPK